MWIRSVIVLAGMLISMSANAAELTDDEQAVWNLEVAYWEYVKSADIPGYRSLWDERFVGWPGFSEKPLDKSNIQAWVIELHSHPDSSVHYDLTMQSVRSYGDVVAVHYLARFSARSDTTGEVIGKESVSRITHTWQRQGDTWRIITGMSGTLIGTSDK